MNSTNKVRFRAIVLNKRASGRAILQFFFRSIVSEQIGTTTTVAARLITIRLQLS